MWKVIFVYHVFVDSVEWSDVNTYFVDRQQGDSTTNVLLGRFRRVPSSTHPETVYNQTIQDNHDYYLSQFFGPSAGGSTFWVDLDNPSIRDDVLAPASLATNERKGTTVALDFTFPFYGHELTSIVITTGGFIYTGSYLHKHLAATQYIAPLMGNFCPSQSENTGVKYYSNGTAMTVEWRNQNLADNIEAGIFSFQTTLFDDGKIIFAYKQIPVPVPSISDNGHPVKVGLADAYYIDKIIAPFTKKRNIFEYHKVELELSQVKSNSAIRINPLPTCNLLVSCDTCVSSDVSFNCTWCERLGRCSDGVDRSRQRWQENNCGSSENFLSEVTQCPGYTTMPAPTELPTTAQGPQTDVHSSQAPVQLQSTKQPQAKTDDYCKGIVCQNGGECFEGFCNCPTNFAGARCQKYVVRHCEAIRCKNGGTCYEGISLHICDCMPGYSGLYCDEEVGITGSSRVSRQGLTVGAVVCITLIGLLICSLFVWAVYAYRHPTSPSGLFIIEAKHRLRGRGRGSNGVKYKYHQQVDSNHVDIQL
ncbi:plexin domain-containing protein 2-like [Asterias rubens]|uniref:plexin domain-containing protein 2-like n=1 Tax=Asterias rubens TaxID=7604 RepID=UPI0014550837|nr:plexin domain-containing protein 2-like [Asterias rubens]